MLCVFTSDSPVVILITLSLDVIDLVMQTSL